LIDPPPLGGPAHRSSPLAPRSSPEPPRSSPRALVSIPFGIHFGVCVNDWGVTYRALREPRGSLVEDDADGILIHPPPVVA
jgi:hypothetical protein